MLRDTHVVSRLRSAGAVLLGHATLSEWADMRSNNYSEGFSSRASQARSPYNLIVNPGGSSSGSAMAVAGNQVVVALGTETDSSVINQAERNAIIGIKLIVGPTNRASVIPEGVHQDTVGTFGRAVRDATYFSMLYMGSMKETTIQVLKSERLRLEYTNTCLSCQIGKLFREPNVHLENFLVIEQPCLELPMVGLAQSHYRCKSGDREWSRITKL